MPDHTLVCITDGDREHLDVHAALASDGQVRAGTTAGATTGEGQNWHMVGIRRLHSELRSSSYLAHCNALLMD